LRSGVGTQIETTSARAIASALGELGNRASQAADRLRAYAAREPNSWTRRRLKAAVEEIEGPESTAGGKAENTTESCRW